MTAFLNRRDLLALAAAAAVAPAFAADNKVLRIGYQKFNTLNILKGAGKLEEALKSLGWTVQWFEFATGPVLFEALNAGSIDFGHAADTPTVFAQAAGVNSVYLAAEQPYPQGIAILVAKDSPVKTIADLKGKKVAVGRGWNVQYLLVRALEDAGLSFDDIQPAWVNNAADARTAFESGKVDAVGLWDPFLAGAQLAGNPRVLRNGEGLSNNRTFYIAHPQYAAAHGPALRTVFAELRKANDWAQAHPGEVVATLAPQLKVEPKVLALATERRHYGVVALTPAIAREQQGLADVFAQLKLIPQPIAVKDAFLDLNLV